MKKLNLYMLHSCYSVQKNIWKVITMEKQYALGLKSLPRATMTPSSNIFLARGCFSLRGGEERCQSPGGTFSEWMQEWGEHACSRRGEKAPGLVVEGRRALASPGILWIIGCTFRMMALCHCCHFYWHLSFSGAFWNNAPPKSVSSQPVLEGTVSG